MVAHITPMNVKIGIVNDIGLGTRNPAFGGGVANNKDTDQQTDQRLCNSFLESIIHVSKLATSVFSMF